MAAAGHDNIAGVALPLDHQTVTRGGDLGVAQQRLAVGKVRFRRDQLFASFHECRLGRVIPA